MVSSNEPVVQCAIEKFQVAGRYSHPYINTGRTSLGVKKKRHNKIDIRLVVYRISGNVMTSKTTLRT